MFVLWILGIATCNVKIVHLRYFHQPQALSKSNSKCFHFRLNLRTFKCPCWYYWKLLIFQTSATEQQASTMYSRWAKPTFGITCQTVGLLDYWTFDWPIKAYLWLIFPSVSTVNISQKLNLLSFPVARRVLWLPLIFLSNHTQDRGHSFSQCGLT